MTMDLAMVAAARFGGAAFRSDRLGPGVIGRWAYGLSHGRWRHDDIGSEPAQRGELVLGALTHYGTGIMLTQAYLLLSGRKGAKPSLLGATAFGVASAALPLLVSSPRSATAGSASTPATPRASTGSCSSATPHSVSGSGCRRRASLDPGRVHEAA